MNDLKKIPQFVIIFVLTMMFVIEMMIWKFLYLLVMHEQNGMCQVMCINHISPTQVKSNITVTIDDYTFDFNYEIKCENPRICNTKMKKFPEIGDSVNCLYREYYHRGDEIEFYHTYFPVNRYVAFKLYICFMIPLLIIYWLCD